MNDIDELEKSVINFLGYVKGKVEGFVEEHKLLRPSTMKIKKLNPELYELAERGFRGGKKVRPGIMYATALAVSRMRGLPFECIEPGLLPYMVMRESIHSGYLIDDDIQDGSELRRGKPAVWKLIGMPRAINVGLLLSDVLARRCESLSYEEPYRIDENKRSVVAKINAKISQTTVEGQDLDLKFRASPQLPPLIVELIYQGKTGGYTIGGPMALGAAIAGLEEELCMELYEVGMKYFGPAYQGTDDVLNLREPKEVPKYGKRWGDDLEEGKPTMIVAIFNELATPEDKEEFYEYVGRRRIPDETKREMIGMLKKYRAIERAKGYVRRKFNRGMRKLSKIIPERHGEELYALLRFSVEREY